jgi:hypothetical protein
LAKKARVYDGTAWQELASAQTDLTAYSTTAEMDAAIAAGSGLKFITGGTFTTATSLSLPDDTFTSTYLNYKMILTLSAVTSDSTFSVRLRTSGTDNTASTYSSMLSGVNSTATFNTNASANDTKWLAAESDSSLVRYAWDFDILQPKVAQHTFISGGISYVILSGAQHITTSGMCSFNANTEFDSLSFISSVASSMTGTYRVYGYSES